MKGITIMALILHKTARGIDRFSTEDSLFSKRELFLVGEVNDDSCNELIKQLMHLDSESDEEITLYINSPGGSVTSGLAVYDYISVMRSPIRTICLGTAASMGAILFLAGTRRDVFPHSEIMIHDPSYGGRMTISGKKPHEIKTYMDSLNETKEMLAEIIAEKTGKSLDEIYAVTAEDSYFKASAAVEFGLATGIINKNNFKTNKGE